LEEESREARHQLNHSELNPMAAGLDQVASELAPDDYGPAWWR
jgi:hypothetical protein